MAARFADGQFHHFAFTLDRNNGLGLGFDGNDPKIIFSKPADELKADSLFNS